MNARRRGPRSVLASVIVLSSVSAFAAPPERTLPVDPVELIAGREVAGASEFSIERDGIEYRFASAENMAAFAREPAKYEAADGGACGRMGALSGLGDARRYAVHAGRIYFFASDGCRTGFLKDPARYIEGEDEPVFGSDEQVQRGRAALDRMASWAGGAERVRGIAGYRASAARTVSQGGTDYAVTNECAIVFPDRYYQKEAWNESWYSTARSSVGSSMATSKGAERIADSRGRAFQRAMARWPIVLLKAHVDGSPRADCPGLIVIADGEGELDGTPVEFVKVWLNGAASRLTIEKASGKLRQLAYRGRDGTMSVGDSVRTYTAWATVDGITLPTAYVVTFDGKENTEAGARIDAFEINSAIPAERFEVP